MIIFFFKIFLIFEISKPPNLNIAGSLTRLIIVDSTPIFDCPPSKI